MTARRILIVDDDRDTRRGLDIRLRANNYETVVAADADTAIKMAQEERPDLILLDLGLPDHDGFFVLERLKTATPPVSIPVIIVSARDPHANTERARNAGALAFFQKPADNTALLGAIRRGLGN